MVCTQTLAQPLSGSIQNCIASLLVVCSFELSQGYWTRNTLSALYDCNMVKQVSSLMKGTYGCVGHRAVVHPVATSIGRAASQSKWAANCPLNRVGETARVRPKRRLGPGKLSLGRTFESPGLGLSRLCHNLVSANRHCYDRSKSCHSSYHRCLACCAGRASPLQPW